jgi:hypothetical protein
MIDDNIRDYICMDKEDCEDCPYYDDNPKNPHCTRIEGAFTEEDEEYLELCEQSEGCYEEDDNE